MLKREELREEYRDLLLKYKLIRIKWRGLYSHGEE